MFPSMIITDGVNLRRKYVMTIAASFFTAISASAGSTYNQGFSTMVSELQTTQYIAGIGLSTYCLGFGAIPLVTASLSEEFGRMPLYITSAAGFSLTHLMIAL
jgi:MFS family permease